MQIAPDMPVLDQFGQGMVLCALQFTPHFTQFWFDIIKSKCFIKRLFGTPGDIHTIFIKNAVFIDFPSALFCHFSQGKRMGTRPGKVIKRRAVV